MVWHPVDGPKETTPDEIRVSCEGCQPIFLFSQKGPGNQIRASQLAGTMHLHIFTEHLNCEVCELTKTARSPCRNRLDARGDCIHPPQQFGDAMTADHKVLKKESESRLQHRYGVAVQNLVGSIATRRNIKLRRRR